MFEKIKHLLSLIFGRNTLDYICGTEALPLPFSQEEESDKISRLERGDEQAKSELVEHNLRLVVYIAKKFEGSGVDGDDLVSVGTIGLIKAINSFKSEKNIKLATYASRCIENEILMYLRRMSRLKQEVSFDEPLNTDWEGNELLLSDVMGTDADSVYSDIEGGVERELLQASLSKLSPREQRIMRMRFALDGGEEMTQKDVADKLGISQSYISRLEKKIISKLKKDISKQIWRSESNNRNLSVHIPKKGEIICYRKLLFAGWTRRDFRCCPRRNRRSLCSQSKRATNPRARGL